MVPSKLKRQLSTKHSFLLSNDVKYFRRLLEQNKKQVTLMTTSVHVSQKVQEASYKAVSYTHLDVYKRQLLFLVTGIDSEESV